MVTDNGQMSRLPRLVLAIAAVAAMNCHAAELPPEIQADRYLVRAERQLQAGDAAAAIATLDRILALQEDHGLEIPAAFWFKHAQALLDAGLFERAVGSSTQYLSQAGRDGEHYLAALEILDEAELAWEAVERKREAAERKRLEREEAERPVVARYRAARERLEAAGGRDEGAFADPLASGGYGPEMVVIPGGAFRMGCLSNDDACYDDEKPVHEVTIAQAFAVSKYEITFEAWDLCVARGGCGGYRPGDEGWGRGARPAIRVSWEDAKNYVNWLTAETGARYRLLSEAEWEYAARAGSTTKYSWGDEIGENRANCRGDHCGDIWERTAPVGSFAANAFGLHDLHGNVWEWVEDCWNDSYEGAPSDGTAWLSGDCEERVLRGGSWYGYPRHLRSADRGRGTASIRSDDLGFRVARTLTP